MIPSKNPGEVRWDLITDAAAELLTDIAGARTALAEGKEAKAWRLAQDALRRLESRPSKLGDMVHGTNRPYGALKASALTVLGMVARQQGQAEADDRLAKASSIFQSLLDEGWDLNTAERTDHIRALLLTGQGTTAFRVAAAAFKDGTGVAPELVVELTRMLDEAGDTERAIELLELARRRLPGDAEIAAIHALMVEGRRPSDEVSSNHVEAAILLAQLGEYQRSEEHFRRAVKAMPDSASAMTGLVQVLLSQGEIDEAQKHIDLLLKQHPDKHEPVALQAIALAMTGEPDAALATVREGIDRFGQRRLLVYTYVRLLLATGATEEVAPWLDRALDQDSDDPDLLRAKANVLLGQNNPSEAIPILQRLRNEFPESVGDRAALARALSEADRDQEAADILLEALKMEPKNPALLTERDRLIGRWMNFVEAHVQKLNDPKVFSTLERVLTVDPDNATAHSRMGDALRLRGRYEEARMHLAYAAERLPDSAWVLGRYGQVLRALDEPEALDILRRAVHLDDTLWWVHTELGDAYRAGGRLRESLTELNRAISLAPDNAWTWAIKGATESLQGDWEASRSSLDRAIAMAPQYGWALAVKADLLDAIDELDEARTAVDAALAIDPGIVWAWGLKAWLVQKMEGALSEELDAVNEGLARSPKDYYLHILLAEALIRDDRSKDAESEFRRVINSFGRNKALGLDELQHLGWCHIRLGEYELALTCLGETLSKDYTRISASFDLALALLCTGRRELALDEYETAAMRTQVLGHPGRRRSLLRVARLDLDRVFRRQRASSKAEAEQVHEILDRYWGTEGAG